MPWRTRRGSSDRQSAVKPPSVFSVFRNRSFTLLWTGQFISNLGSALTNLAASVLVFRETGSALSVGLMLMATSGPTVLIGLVAGVLVDRYDRKRILILADGVRAILIFLIPLLIRYDLSWLYILVALVSAITQFFDSAHASVLPETASDEELSAANALMTISSIGSMTIGYAAAGFIASSFAIEWAFYLDAFSFVVSAGLIMLARLPTLERVDDTSLRAIRRNLQVGLRTVSTTPSLRSLFLVLIPTFFLYGLQNTLLLPFALRELNGTEFDFGLQQGAEAIGLAVGSLLMARYMDRLREGQWLAMSFMAMGVSSLFYSLSPVMTLAIVLLGVTGFLNAPSYIGRTLLIQRATPRELRGRVNSALFVVRDTMFVLGMALAGLADMFNVRTLLVMDSLALLAVGASALFLPGLSRPAAEWKRTLSLLKGAEAAPRLGAGRTATRSDIDRLVSVMKELAGMTPGERDRLAAQMFVAGAAPGTVITYRGEASDMAYFILKGSVAAGYLKDDDYVIARTLGEGEFFGEIAALTGAARTANVITEESSEFLIVPARVLRELSSKYEGVRQMFRGMVSERLRVIDLLPGTSLDQDMLRELRTNPVGDE